MIRAISFVLLICTSVVLTASAQTNAPTTQEQLMALMKEVRAQQAELTANQTKIDEKLAPLAEAIRQARLYSSRGGR